jgi:hypothetical protein
MESFFPCEGSSYRTPCRERGMDLLEKAYKLLNYSNCPPFEKVFDNDKKGIVKRRIHKD